MDPYGLTGTYLPVGNCVRAPMLAFTNWSSAPALREERSLGRWWFSLLLSWVGGAALAYSDLPPASQPDGQQKSELQIDGRTRNEVLISLANELERRYVVPETAERLARLVRTKQRTNAYKNIRNGPDFAWSVTHDMFVVAHDKHLHVDFRWAPTRLTPTGPPPPEVMDQMRRENGAIPKLEILDGNVGYMRVNGVPPLDLSRPQSPLHSPFSQHGRADP